MRKNIFIILCISVFGGFFVYGHVCAETVSSSNFRIRGSSFNSGGVASATSSNYLMIGSFGEALAGESSSTNFNNEGGVGEVIADITATAATAVAEETATAVRGGGGGIIGGGAGVVSECNGADFNLDGDVDAFDFATLIFYWKVEKPLQSCVDINKDGVVDAFDFAVLVFEWTP